MGASVYIRLSSIFRSILMSIHRCLTCNLAAPFFPKGFFGNHLCRSPLVPSCPLLHLLAQTGLSHPARSSSPLCAIFHICIHLRTSILFLAPECMQKALNVLDQWRTLTFVVQHPLLTLLPPCLDFFVCRSTVCFFFIRDSFGCPPAALLNSSACSCSRDFPVGATVYIRSDNTFQLSLTSMRRCLACSLRRSLRKVFSVITSVRAPLVVKVGHRFFCDSVKSSQSSAS